MVTAIVPSVTAAAVRGWTLMKTNLGHLTIWYRYGTVSIVQREPLPRCRCRCWRRTTGASTPATLALAGLPAAQLAAGFGDGDVPQPAIYWTYGAWNSKTLPGDAGTDTNGGSSFVWHDVLRVRRSRSDALSGHGLAVTNIIN